MLSSSKNRRNTSCRARTSRMEWGHLANLIRMGLHHQLLSKGSFEMKRVIITFFATLMATNAFAQTQISPDQMRAEMAKSATAREWNSAGVRMCPPDIEYHTTSLRLACGSDDNSACHDLQDAAFNACDKQFLDCYHRWVEDTKTINAYNAWIRACYTPQQAKPISPSPVIKPLSRRDHLK